MPDLSHLTDNELIQYYELMKSLSKRGMDTKIHSFDCKFAYHVIRLLGEIEQILTEGDLDLQRNREQLKAIRRGEWKQEEIIEYFNKREKELESVYDNSTLPHKPREAEIKELLIECLEHHYGSLDKCIVSEDKLEKALREISNIANRVLK